MRSYLNLPTRAKLLTAFGALLALIALLIVFAHQALSHMRESQRRLVEVEMANVIDLKEIRSNQLGLRANLMQLLLAPDPATSRELHADIERRKRENERDLKAVLAREGTGQASRELLREFEATTRAATDLREGTILPLLAAGKTEEVKTIIFGVHAQRDARLRELANSLVDDSVRTAAQSVERSAEAARSALSILLWLAAFALVGGLAAAWLLARVLAEPMTQLAQAARQVAAGDLRVEVADQQRSDETGQLGTSFRLMLTGMRDMMREMGEGVRVLSASAAEITASTAQVAAASKQTASAVGETSATADEVKQTAKLAAEKARHVQETAQRTVQTSQDGLRAMDESIGALRQIEQQMEAIAQATLRLADQGAAIGEIIATVTDLADQSNVLSVNAAIEAARAGEEGTGFRVVAQEIRSLADQSKQATAQVRKLLGDIQQATSSAVLATEQGNKAVQSGVRLAEDAAESIRALAVGISEAAQAATQIAASAQQQAVGMDQVAYAMQNINEASAQNVAASRQTEVAALGLQELGMKLKAVTDRYKV